VADTKNENSNQINESNVTPAKTSLCAGIPSVHGIAVAVEDVQNSTA
jgi:hypothetical protein